VKKYLASLFFLGALLVQAAPYTFPTESSKPGSAGTPGQLDKEFKSLLGSGVKFIGKPDIRTAMIQTDGKILIGGTFRISASGLNYADYDIPTLLVFDNFQREYVEVVNQPISFTVVWRNLARLNADGTIDTSFVSKSALDLAQAELGDISYTNKISLEYGPDGAVYSILHNQATGDPLSQYLVAGDFLNFSHNQFGNSEPRKRFLVIGCLRANKIEASGLPQPLVELTDNVAEGDGFNGPVRRMRRMNSNIRETIDYRVANRPDRLWDQDPMKHPYFKIGDVVLQEDNSFIYQKISDRLGPGVDDEDDDWVNLPNARQTLYFATGDFTSFIDDTDQRYITRFVLRNMGIVLPSTIGILWDPPKPDGRVWDVTSINGRIFFVGEFTSVQNNLPIFDDEFDDTSSRVYRYRIAAITENGKRDPWFDPGDGFNNNAMSIVADPQYKSIGNDPLENKLVVGGYFTEYDGKPVNYIARISLKYNYLSNDSTQANPNEPEEPRKDGALDESFPAPNYTTSGAIISDRGANGPIRVVTRQPDGRFFIAGEFTTYNGIKRAGLARLEPDGSLDLTFVPAGTASGIQNFAFDMDGGPGTASSFARPVAVGNFSKLFGSNFTGVARFIGGTFPVVWYQPNKINAPFAVSLGDDKTLSVAASDNFVGYTGEFGLPTGLEELPFESPQTPSDPLLYQWEKYTGGKWRKIQGEVLSYLMIENFKPEDATTYRVRIWNSQFSIYSETVNVGLRNPFTDKIPDTGLQVQGLIEANETLNGGLGGYISFTMTRTGMVTGTVTLGNVGGKPVKVSFRRQYNFDTGLEVQIPLPNKSPLVLRLKTTDFSGTTSNATTAQDVDFSGPGNELTDSFGTTAAINASNVPWTKFISAKSFAGKYNIGLQTDTTAMEDLVGTPPVDQPMVSQGFGYLTMQVAEKTGVARMVGLLADGSKVTASTSVRGNADGTVTLWLPLYASQGSLSGTFSILSEADSDGVLPAGAVNPVSGDLKWSKPPGVPKSPDVSGFSSVAVTAIDGSGLYDPATAAPSSLSMSDGAWAGKPGCLNDPSAAVTFRFSKLNGLVNGSFTDADSQGRPRKVNCRGITLTGTGSPDVYGFFIMPSAVVKNPDFYVGGSVIGN